MENDQLALRIRAFRKLKGYTQQELADQMGVSVAVLGAIGRGPRRADSKILEKIADTLGIGMEELLNRA